MSDCIEFTGYVDPKGYGRVRRNGAGYLAHRWAWIQERGPIPTGAVLRHTCDNPLCINTEHLELGTQADNVRDMVERGRACWQTGTHYGANKTCCSNGHEFTAETAYLDVRGHRVCRTCQRERNRAWRLRQQETAS